MASVKEQYLQYLAESETGREWIESMEDYVDLLDQSRVHYLDLQHTAFMMKRGGTLLITCEMSEDIVMRRSKTLPTGWDTAEQHGWSYLCLCAEGVSEYPTDVALDYLNEQIGKGELAQFETVVVFGSARAASAAVACGALIDKATVVVAQPQWTSAAADDKDGATEVESGRLIVAYDPAVAGQKVPGAIAQNWDVHALRCWHLGDQTDYLLRSFGVTPHLLEMAQNASISFAPLYPLLRKRHNVRSYWRGVLRQLDSARQPKLVAQLCRNVLDRTGGKVFKQKLRELEAA